MIASILAVALTLPVFDQTSDCFAATASHPNVANPAVLARGQALDDDQELLVQAAIQMIGEWEADCGVTPPDQQVAQDPPKKASKALSDAFKACSICAEAVADGQAITGNANYDGFTDGAGWTYDVVGAPGINVEFLYFGEADPNGDYALLAPDGSELARFSSTEVAELAFVLLHELEHFVDPQAAGSSKAVREGPAYTYEAQQLCKIAGCPTVSDEVKALACEYITKANHALAVLCFPQVPCWDCPHGAVIAWVKAPPPPDSPRALLFADAPSSRWETQPHVSTTFAGVVTLDRTHETLTIDSVSMNGVHPTIVVDLAAGPLAGFDAQDLVQLDEGRSLVFGRDAGTGLGVVVDVTYDVAAGNVTSLVVSLASGQFRGARDATLRVFPSGQRVVFVLDQQARLGVYDPDSSSWATLADTSTSLALDDANDISFHTLLGSFGYAILGRDDAYDSAMAADDATVPVVGLLDLDLDGVFDGVVP